MKGKGWILIMLLAGTMAYGQIPEDKAKHFVAGAVIGGIGGYLGDKIFHGKREWTFASAIGASFAAGFAKEIWDHEHRGGEWDNGDITATVLGGITAGVTIDIFTQGKRKRRERWGDPFVMIDLGR